MYVNLDRELRANALSYRSAAAAINMPEPTFRSKLSDGRFYIDEVFAIKSRLLPKYDLEYLFANDSTFPNAE